MPAVTMVISPPRTSQIHSLDCAFLCRLTHSDVKNTEPQKGTLCANCKKGGQSFFSTASILSGKTQHIGTDRLPQMDVSILLRINMMFQLILKFAAVDLNRAIGRHPKFSSIDKIGDTMCMDSTKQCILNMER
jgi:hypothetical protein